MNRNSEQQRIAGREVVRDDIVPVSEGDRVPADAVMLASTNLSAAVGLLSILICESVKLPPVQRLLGRL